MLNYLVKSILSRYFKLEYNITLEDPYYDRIPINNNKTKFKKIPRKLPDKLSLNDELILKKINRRAYRYDMLFNIIGVPVGTSNLIQIVPVAGIVYSTYNSLQLVYLAMKLTNGFPYDLLIFCILNIIFDLLIGLIPIVGDLINISFKANTRNYSIIKGHLFKVSDYNEGLITKDQIRNNWFINRFNWFKGEFEADSKTLVEVQDDLKKY